MGTLHEDMHIYDISLNSCWSEKWFRHNL